jgi:hypothetical protein
VDVEALLPQLRKARAAWLEVPGHPPRLAWVRWLDDALYVVHGGGEQQLPGLADATQVVVTTTAGTSGPADVSVVPPGDPLWESVSPRLHAARHNPPSDPVAWRAGSVLSRIRPLEDRPD